MKLILKINGKEISAHFGEKLSDVLIRNGLYHEQPCGGRGVCGKCKVLVNGREELACRYILEENVTVEVMHGGKILSENGVSAESDGVGTDLVLDIGTTTLAMALVDKKAEKVLKVINANNKQRQFGSDVISRIEYCRKNGVSELSQIIREQTNEMIHELGAYGIETLHVAGNTTMLHILAGADPSSMGVSPYAPSFLDEKFEIANKFGIIGVGKIHLLPSISAFVGADLVAGVNLIGPPTEKYRLLIDLGTNAEIILFSKDKIIATAAAAGPCFEGANISCGMSAVNGAIYAYDGKTIKTVGGLPPKGICGTGLVDVISECLRKGVIDESGYMENKEFEIAEGVYLTQADVRQYQLAKSAVYSAAVTLIRQNGIEFSDIEALYISGGFSEKMNIDNAVYTGLIPCELKNACVSLGNSSLLGAIKSVFEGSELSEITDKAEYVELSGEAVFSEMFIDSMGFKV